MNELLESIARDVGLADPARQRLALFFAYACADRVRHLLEQQEVLDCLDVLRLYLDDQASAGQLQASKLEAARLANGHEGSRSIDGCGHAAVSATYAVAKALNGGALEAASYAAYATVYAQGGSAAVAHRDSFEQEFSWQCAELKALAERVRDSASKTAS